MSGWAAGDTTESLPSSSYIRLSHYNAAMDFQLVTSYKPKGDQPRAIDELMRGLAARGKAPGAAGRDGLGQDLHHGQGDRAVEPAGADPGA